jgi:hypothetical protein
MSQYVLQIREGDGWLAKSFEVTEKSPVPSTVPVGRVQIIMTNTQSFDEIVSAYAQHATNLVFSYIDPDISCSGAYAHTWSKD